MSNSTHRKYLVVGNMLFVLCESALTCCELDLAPDHTWVWGERCLVHDFRFPKDYDSDAAALLSIAKSHPGWQDTCPTAQSVVEASK